MTTTLVDTSVVDTAPHPFFMPAPTGYGGHRFCLFHAPAVAATKGWVVYVHPFAEEMNKSRRMAALQSRALARAGFGVLQIDLLGCGDSSGDFGDASWEAWIADVCHGAQWLLQQGRSAPLWLWGLRAGCLLASEAAARLNMPCNLLFWQPSAAGKSVLQQFLRLKLAGGLGDGHAKGAMEDLKRQLADGRAVEVAGYRLPPDLANRMSTASLTAPASVGRMEWLEVSSRAATAPASASSSAVRSNEGGDAGLKLMPASEAVIDRWQKSGWSVHSDCVEGPSFWQTTEIEDAPHLLAATLDAIKTRDDDAVPEPCAPPCGPGMLPDFRRTTSQTRTEAPVLVPCAGETMVGVLRTPPQNTKASDTAVVVIVGGPQYRAGSHRHFVLLSRHLAAAGHPVLCFDYRGMGDSTGSQRSFESVGTDVAAAIDRLQAVAPAVKRVVLWGLCDGASAALLYLFGSRDPRVVGLCLLNPWVRSNSSLARTHVKHYYASRLRQGEFWQKLLSGQVAWAAVRGLWNNLARAAGNTSTNATDGTLSYQDKMIAAWEQFGGRALLVLSGKDYTAKEFLDQVNGQLRWQRFLEHPASRLHRLEEADHTFSDPRQEEKVEQITLMWLAEFLFDKSRSENVEPSVKGTWPALVTQE